MNQNHGFFSGNNDVTKSVVFGVLELRFFMFCFAILIYAVFSSPTPDHIGVFEVICILLIFASVGIRRPLLVIQGLSHRGVDGQIPASKYGQGAVLFFLYGISIPILVAALLGNDINSMFRDIVAFLFLSLPFLLGSLITRRWSFLPILTFLFFLLGLIFSIRASGDILNLVSSDEMLYLAISPSVIFCAVLSVAILVSLFFENKYKVYVLFLLPLAVAGLYFPFITMVDTAQRASIGVLFLFSLVVILAAIYFYPRKSVIFLLLLSIPFFFFWEFLGDVFYRLETKNSLVGFNMRIEEFKAVIFESEGSILRVLFGCGWGCSFNSPAVGGLSVNFTHNLFSFYLLKTGLFGVALLFLYLIPIVESLNRLLYYRPALALALMCPLLINLTLYASFKSFDFGIVLLLIVGWSARAVQVKREYEDIDIVDNNKKIFRLI